MEQCLQFRKVTKKGTSLLTTYDNYTPFSFSLWECFNKAYIDLTANEKYINDYSRTFRFDGDMKKLEELRSNVLRLALSLFTSAYYKEEDLVRIDFYSINIGHFDEYSINYVSSDDDTNKFINISSVIPTIIIGYGNSAFDLIKLIRFVYKKTYRLISIISTHNIQNYNRFGILGIAKSFRVIKQKFPKVKLSDDPHKALTEILFRGDSYEFNDMQYEHPLEYGCSYDVQNDKVVFM